MAANKDNLVGIGVVLITAALAGLINIFGFSDSLASRSPALSHAIFPHTERALVRLAEMRITTPPLDNRKGPIENEKPNTPASGQASGNGGLQPASEPAFALSPDIMERTARRAVQTEPNSASALRVLGYALDRNGRKDLAQRLMLASTRRSSHDPQARYWFLKEAIQEGKLAEALHHTDALYRTFASLQANAVAMLAIIADQPGGQDLLLAELKKNPPWTRQFLASYPKATQSASNPSKLFLALKQAGVEIDADLIQGQILNLFRLGKLNEAYFLWLQSLSQRELAKLPLLYNGDFQLEPSKSIFDWYLGNPPGARTEIVGTVNDPESRHLQVSFFGERARYNHTQQILMLTPGSFKMTGDYKALNIDNPRGLVWRITCLSEGKTAMAGEGPRLKGNSKAWETFSFTFDIPMENCDGQLLSLALAARNGPETLVSGQILFDNLAIFRNGQQNAQTPDADLGLRK